MKLEDIKDYFKQQPLMYLATTEGDQPRVRPMALIYHKEICWCCSISGRPKIKQIIDNNKIEFAINALDKEEFSTIRGSGKAVLVEDLETKKELSEVIPWFSGYWKSYDNPEFTLFRMDIERIEVQIPKRREFHIFDLKENTVEIEKK
ncbi:MAG: pyridoxamine 5'-phosphate oxidase family protein [Candidatus Heimdallarchaeota archaeon]|nr:pyridoxamine 5'-phosphate oxidase family protein [Candidatus Heimdallarchaeota archaeon]MCK4878388.1 pyridoxamine 5'-phosphate oxidase family protein [Candidatus Heimdallarchaeota archaeon]